MTANYHIKCMTPKRFNESKLDQFFNIVTTNQDDKNKSITFISTIEAKDYPFYGVQWHPEKNQFEFVLNKNHENIPHDYNAILVGQYMANFIVQEARKNNNTFENNLRESEALIYNYGPVYSGKERDATFEQIYLFSGAAKLQWCVKFNIILFFLHIFYVTFF